MARFTLFLGRNLVAEYVFTAGPLEVGRHPDAHILLGHEAVSRRHARLDRVGTQWMVEDVGGRNGTFVNGVYASFAMLRDGDEIEIGNYLLRFQEAAQERSHARDLATRTPGSSLFRTMDSVMGELEGDADVPATTPHTSRQEATITTASLSTEKMEELRQRLSQLRGAHLAWFDAGQKRVLTPVTEGRILIGKTPAAEIRVTARWPAVSEFAVVVREGVRTWVEPRSRWVRVLVDAQPVVERGDLKDGAHLTVAHMDLLFHDALRTEDAAQRSSP